jgi:hypothetical protein
MHRFIANGHIEEHTGTRISHDELGQGGNNVAVTLWTVNAVASDSRTFVLSGI